MAKPTADQLAGMVDEIGWSLVCMVKHLKISRIEDRDGRQDRGIASFDGMLLHMRAIVEFLLVAEAQGRVVADHYCQAWDVGPSATAAGLDGMVLYRELSAHAFHLSKVRANTTPDPNWDAVPIIEQLLAVFHDFIAAADQVYQQPFSDWLTEARLQLMMRNSQDLWIGSWLITRRLPDSGGWVVR